MNNDCFYYQNGNCQKGLPGTKCERVGCYAYRQKINYHMTQKESQKLETYILQHFPMTNRQFSQALGVTINVIKYHIKKLGLVGQRKRGAIRLYDEYIRTNYPMYSASIIARKLGITPNTVNIIARRLGVKHNSDFIIAPYPIKENLVGKKYGKLTVQKQLGTNMWGQMVYQCICECGKITYSTAGNLKNSHVTSCGCKRKKIKHDKER